MPYDRTKYVTATPLEEVCFDFMQDAKDFIGDAVATPKPVSKSDNKVYQADTAKLRLFDTEQDTESKVQLIDENLFPRTFTLKEYKLGKNINPKTVRDADVPSMFGETRAAKIVTNALLMAREKKVADLVRTAANYQSSLTSTFSTAADYWNGSGDPEAQKQGFDQAVMAASGVKRTNAMACDIQVIRALRSNAAFIDRTKYTSGDPIQLAEIKKFFDVDYVFIAGTMYDSAQEGATRSLSSPWGKDVIFYHYNPSPALEDVSFAHMYMSERAFWTKLIVDEDRNGPAGSMKRLEVGTEYLIDKGYVESESSNKFAAGYLVKSVIP